MIIQTIGKKYTVLEYRYADSHFVYYICKESGKKSKYSMVCIKDKQWICQVTKFLMEQMENSYFTDFVSCFFREEYLYVLMKYPSGTSFREKIGRMHDGLKERMVIGKHILEKAMLLKMPDYFLQDCLRMDRIRLSPSLEVEFQYGLSDINMYESCDFSDVQECLGNLFQELFKQEIEKCVLPAASQFCDALSKGEYSDMLEIYEAYQELSRSIDAISPEELKQPRTPGFRIWETIRGQMGLWKKICALLLLMGALVFLAYTVCQTRQPGGKERVFTSIGTLKIR